MTRLYHQSRHDPIDVRRRDDVPEQFLWRGRLYIVRAVLACWTESGAWWRRAAVRGLAAGTSPDRAAPDRAAPDRAAPDIGPAGLDDGECDWWRVEADSGRHAAMSAGVGVYDLCFDWSRGSWSLARVMD